MKIDKTIQPQAPERITKSPSVKPRSDAAAVRGTSATDKVELSGLKDEVARLKAKIKEIPEVDEAKVAKIKQALHSGTYQTDNEALARSIMKSDLLDETD